MRRKCHSEQSEESQNAPINETFIKIRVFEMPAHMNPFGRASLVSMAAKLNSVVKLMSF